MTWIVGGNYANGFYTGLAYADQIQKSMAENVERAFAYSAVARAEDRQLDDSTEKIKDCRNCEYGYADDHWNTPMCHYNGMCNNWERWEPKEEHYEQ